MLRINHFSFHFQILSLKFVKILEVTREVSPSFIIYADTLSVTSFCV
jgi:hypothetical protein